MALTRTFREARRPFCRSLMAEAVNTYLGGDEETGTAVSRDVVNATIGFEQLAVGLVKSAKSFHRMLGPRGNPPTANLFAVPQVLQNETGWKLTVKAA